MGNKYILHIIIANILWSLIPVLVIGLFDEISIFMIIFLRFFISGIILFFIALCFIFYNNKHAQNDKMRISLKKILQFTLNKNESFYNIRYIYFFAIIGFFGIILQIIGFFFALKVSTISFTMIGFQLSIVVVAIYEHGIKSETLDFFKILYLLILLFSVGIIAYVQMINLSQGGISFWGVFFVCLFALSASFLHVSISKESFTNEELKFININKNYKFCRLMVKLSLIFIIGIFLMFPFLLILYFIPISAEITLEINQFFNEFQSFFQYLFRWEILFLIIFSTLIPFILIFIASVKWSSYNLSYSQWNSVLTLIEPIGGVLFGVLLGIESFPLIFLVIVIFLLTISILLRYVHESHNQVSAFLLLTKKKGTLKGLNLKLLKFNGIYAIHSLIGHYDMLINVRTNSIREFYYLVNEKLRKLEEIKSIQIFFINKIKKIP